jgi:hypothetical protein
MTDKVESLVEALARQRTALAQKQTLDFSGRVQFPPSGLERIGSPKQLTTLILTGCPLRSLQSLCPQQCLRTLLADRSRVEVLTGLGRHISLSTLSLADTPVGETPNFRTAALILIPKLSVINGGAVTAAERALRDSYPRIAQPLVNAGWIVQAPPPCESDFEGLAREMGVPGAQEDFQLLSLSGKLADERPPASPAASPPPAAPPRRWRTQLAAVLAPLGFAIRSGPTMRADIEKAVRLLCNATLKMEDVYRALPQEGSAAAESDIEDEEEG